jgi:hypothetical protein
MGILEISVDIMGLAGASDLTSPYHRLFSLIFLLVALFLARHLKLPQKP